MAKISYTAQCALDEYGRWIADVLEEQMADRKTEPQTEPLQTCSVNGRPYDCGNCEYHKCTADEPQTDCNGCKFVGTYDTEFPCANCSRKTKDYYAKDEPQTERSE